MPLIGVLQRDAYLGELEKKRGKRDFFFLLERLGGKKTIFFNQWPVTGPHLVREKLPLSVLSRP